MEGLAPSLSPRSAERNPLGNQSPPRTPGNTPMVPGEVFHPRLRTSEPRAGPTNRQLPPSPGLLAGAEVVGASVARVLVVCPPAAGAVPPAGCASAAAVRMSPASAAGRLCPPRMWSPPVPTPVWHSGGSAARHPAETAAMGLPASFQPLSPTFSTLTLV